MKRQEGFECSVGAIKRFLRSLGKRSPQKAVVVLQFEAGEAAQVDFGNGPMLRHPVKNKAAQSYVFVTTLCDSRHMYAELVWDQTVETWLRCHVRAFEFFGGVPTGPFSSLKAYLRWSPVARTNSLRISRLTLCVAAA